MDCDLYWTFKEDKITKKKIPVKPGFTTSSTSRPLILDQLAEEIEKETAELRDADIISQCETFINNLKGKPEADGDFLDDLVMATAIGGQAIKDHPYEKPKEKKHRPERIRPDNAGFGF